MRNYEIMYIVKANLDETGRKEVIEKLNTILTDNGATVTKVDETMGLRDLAYPINDETKGYYVVLDVTADEKATSEFSRLVKINQNVLRHIVVLKHE
ncbi:MAG: 30S ribosomal protein S6 [Bacilli bacterium]